MIINCRLGGLNSSSRNYEFRAFSRLLNLLLLRTKSSQYSWMVTIHLKGPNLGQRVYKTPLTTKSHEHKTPKPHKIQETLSRPLFVVCINLHKVVNFLILTIRNQHSITILTLNEKGFAIFNKTDYIIKVLLKFFNRKCFHSIS